MIDYLKKKRSVCDFMGWASILHQYLARKGVPFTDKGLPVIPAECFLDFLPNGYGMLPYDKGWSAKCKSRTVLCGFEDDRIIYAHVRNLVKAVVKGGDRLERALAFFRQFFAVCGFDLSVCRNMPLEEQEMFFLLNQLLNASLAVNGIRLVVNFRMGSEETLPLLATVCPQEVACAVGTLGCRCSNHIAGEVFLKVRLLALRPSQLLIYGPFTPRYRRILDEENVRFRHFVDYRTRAYAKGKEVA